MKHGTVKKFFVRCKEVLLEQFFPDTCPFCDRLLSYRNLKCDRCFNDLPKLRNVCPTCGKEQCICEQFVCLDRATAPFFYEDQVRDAIHRFKFEKRYDYARPFGAYLAELLITKGLADEIDCIVPVPMDRRREAKRGYNQALYLAQEVGERLNLPVAKDALRKKKDVPIQHLLSYEERRVNLKDAYFPGKSSVRGKRVLLCDDVYTTGATLESCAKALKEQGAVSVLGVVIAITHKS